MISKGKINRINELARKAKKEQLSPEETRERDELRREYIAAVRHSFKSHMDNVKYVEDMTPEEIERLSPEQKKRVQELSERNKGKHKN